MQLVGSKFMCTLQYNENHANSTQSKVCRKPVLEFFFDDTHFKLHSAEMWVLLSEDQTKGYRNFFCARKK